MVGITRSNCGFKQETSTIWCKRGLLVNQMKVYELHKQVLSKIQTTAYHFSFKPFKMR